LNGGVWWVLAGLWCIYLSFGLIAASVAPIVVPIEADLQMSHAQMGSVMGAWQLVYIFAAIPCGVLLDKLGGRWSLVIGVLLVALSALGRAFAVDYWTFLLAVMLFGVGGPIISSGAPKVVAELFEGSRRGLAMGIYMTGPAIGGVVGLTLTNSWLLPMFDMSWRAVMMLWACVGVVAGIAWLAISYATAVAARPIASTQTPVPQLQIMRELLVSPAVRVVLVMSVGVFLYNHGLNNWLVELLKTGGMTAVSAGYWAALPTLVGILGSLLIPRLATPERRFKILFLLCAVAFVASVLLQYTTTGPISVGLILQGIARSSMMTVLILTLVELPGIGDKRAGVASGMFFSAAEVGGMLGPLSLGILFDLHGNFSAALMALSLVCLLLMAGVVYLARVTRQNA
jgi:cyanate permease